MRCEVIKSQEETEWTRRDLNPEPSPCEGDVLPLNYEPANCSQFDQQYAGHKEIPYKYFLVILIEFSLFYEFLEVNFLVNLRFCLVDKSLARARAGI